ncbi:MAG: NUDIX domain-containing protein [Candidatus Woesearchaeota archaeon]
MVIECCADMIAFYESKLVLIERLSTPLGLALPGGRLDSGESLEQCAVREYLEETGLNFNLRDQFRTYSDPNRDPRGQKVSTVFYGLATGKIKNEVGKTRVILLDIKDLETIREKFVFDHYIVIKDFLRLKESFMDEILLN